MTRIFALSLQGRPLPAIHALPLALVLLMIPALALAHDGFQYHPHGVQFGWLSAAVIGAVGVLAVVRFRGPK